jgi:magnesium-transporting ATPase (P-type)
MDEKYKNYSEIEQSILTKDIESLSDVRQSLLEMAFSYRRTGRLYVTIIAVIIIMVIVLFLAVRYFIPTVFEMPGNDITSQVSSSTLHIASVVLIIYLAQLLIGFSRYHYRVADKLFSQANAVTICITSGDIEKLGEFVSSMSLDIDFGKTPETPTDKILDTIAKMQSAKPNK